MKIRCVAFNTYLLATVLLLGCKTPQEKADSVEARKEKRQLSAIRLHLETGGETASRVTAVPILRSAPTLINVEPDSFLDERDVIQANLHDNMGGFVIEIKFNEHGTLVLDGTSSANKGKRVAIMSEFGENRWLAAPVLTRRITDGVFVFTPDATRDEAIRIVRGLNNGAAKLAREERFLPSW